MSIDTLRPDRCVRFDGSFNFRDLGGYPTVDGQRVRWGRLYRSDALDRLSGPARDRLRELNVATIIELRTTDEVGNRAWATDSHGVSSIHAPIPDMLPPRAQLDGLMEAAFVASRYHDMLERGRDAICEVLAVLTDPSLYPVAFTCKEGRDRAGIVAAIVLGLLGVPDEAILNDYMLSREALIRRQEWLLQEYPGAATDVASYGGAETAVMPEAIAGFIAILRAVHGSFLGYAKAIDMDGAIPYLRQNLLSA